MMLPASIHGNFLRARPWLIRTCCSNARNPPGHRRPRRRVHRAGRSLRKLHSSGHDSFPRSRPRVSEPLGNPVDLPKQPDLSLIALIGVILLIGIVKKNAIMMIDFRARRRAAVTASRLSMRSSISACFCRFRSDHNDDRCGIVPASALGVERPVTEQGCDAPLGIAIVGGLIFSQMLTLYTTPVIYVYLDRFRLSDGRVRTSRSVATYRRTPGWFNRDRYSCRRKGS